MDKESGEVPREYEHLSQRDRVGTVIGHLEPELAPICVEGRAARVFTLTAPEEDQDACQFVVSNNAKITPEPA
jgi:hypothetical protein